MSAERSTVAVSRSSGGGSNAPHRVSGGMRASFIALLALVATVWTAPMASAHNWLTSSNPAANSSITSAPAAVQLTFNDRVLTQPAPPQVVVTGPDGKHYETACARTTDRQVDVAWKPGSPGTYRVEYRIVSADGHPVSSSMSFAYRGASSGNAGRDEALSCGAGSAGQSASASSGPAEAESDGSSGPVIVAVAVAVLAAGAIITMILRSRSAASGPSREASQDDDSDEDDEHDDDRA